MRLVVVALLVVAALGSSEATAAGPDDTGAEVAAVQESLAEFGYVVKVDGVYGRQTTRAVRHFQRASGLLADGLAGPVTIAALNGPARATATAVRGPQTQLTPPPPSGDVGLWMQPFAPEGLGDCDEMTFYRVQWGLPSAFDGIGWRESNCRNEDAVRTSCCHGYWQMYTSLHLQSSVLRPKMHACGVFSHHDLNSDVPIEKQRQACAAGALYSVSGTSPWSATR